MAARTGHLTVLRELAPYIWPAGRPDLRMRVVMALVALIIAKAITLMVPIAYKAIVDLLTDEATGKQITAVGLAASPVLLIVAYGVGRVLMVLLPSSAMSGSPWSARTPCASSTIAPSAICTRCPCAFISSAARAD